MTESGSVSGSGGLVSHKIAGRHRDRLAIVYVRQSTVQQTLRLSLAKTSSTNQRPILCVRVRQHHSTENPRIRAANEVLTSDSAAPRPWRPR